MGPLEGHPAGGSPLKIIMSGRFFAPLLLAQVTKASLGMRLEGSSFKMVSMSSLNELGGLNTSASFSSSK